MLNSLFLFLQVIQYNTELKSNLKRALGGTLQLTKIFPDSYPLSKNNVKIVTMEIMNCDSMYVLYIFYDIS